VRGKGSISSDLTVRFRGSVGGGLLSEDAVMRTQLLKAPLYVRTSGCAWTDKGRTKCRSHYVDTVASPAETRFPSHHRPQAMDGVGFCFSAPRAGKRGLYVVRLGPETGIWSSAGCFPSRNERREKIAGRRGR
jgi:hypothetical protein